MIRGMRQSDLAAVAEIEKACFSVPWTPALLSGGLHNPLDRYMVLEARGEVRGYAVLRVLAGEGEIQRIAVLPEHRGRGYGKELMEALVSSSKELGADSVSLEVRSGNTAARNLYKIYGFCEEAVRRGYYRDPAEDAVIMWNRSI